MHRPGTAAEEVLIGRVEETHREPKRAMNRIADGVYFKDDGRKQRSLDQVTLLETATPSSDITTTTIKGRKN